MKLSVNIRIVRVICILRVSVSSWCVRWWMKLS